MTPLPSEASSSVGGSSVGGSSSSDSSVESSSSDSSVESSSGDSSVESSSGDSASAHGISDTLEKLRKKAEQSDEVSLEEFLAVFGSRSFGPMLLVPSLLALIPIVGSIPGVSVLTALWILLVAFQILLLREHPWLPSWLKKKTFGSQKVVKACDKALPYVESMERWLRPRLTVLTRRPFTLLVALICMVLAVSMVPLAVIPFGVTLPALALTLLAVGITVHDGLVIAVGLGITIGNVWFVWWAFLAI